jgi:endo-1,3(4)-beta-glucanase
MASYARLVHATVAVRNQSLAKTGLENLKRALSMWYNNRQKRKLIYENVWGGVVTSWAYDVKDSNVDYGNAIYNDHHFQYGYLVYAASVVAGLDPTWLSVGDGQIIKRWVNSLVRDFANPVEDMHFPFSRAFDWYHGHSWATGLDPAVDGKNEESTSEDAFALYAVKLWGYVSGDAVMEARANLQLAILKRSLKNYFLMESGNENQPPTFIGNKVSGIVSVGFSIQLNDTGKLINRSYLKTRCIIQRFSATTWSLYTGFTCSQSLQSLLIQDLRSL